MYRQHNLTTNTPYLWLNIFTYLRKRLVGLCQPKKTYHASVECLNIIEGSLETQESKSLYFFLNDKGLSDQSYGGLTLQVQLTLQL